MTNQTLRSPSPRRAFPALLLALLSAATAFAAEAARQAFDVPAGDARPALRQFAAQAKREIVFPVDLVGGLKTNAVKGELTPREAIDTMLAGTGLVAALDQQTGAFAVRRSTPLPGPKETARADSTPTTRAESQQAIELDRFEVTGSRLKQTEVEGFSPVIAFEAAFIERSGFGTLSEFLQTLPQNYTGAATGRLGVPNDANPTLFTRSAGQSGVGLRGLGSNSTLVLIDGRRAPLSGKANPSTTPPQSFFDVNTIPFGMVERIEVLTDGASAIYGTDAIGGVINIILKKNYNRVEAKARFAGTTHGGGFERGATLTSGYNRGRIKATLVIDFFEREALLANQRWFSRDGDLRPRGGIDQRALARRVVRRGLTLLVKTLQHGMQPEAEVALVDLQLQFVSLLQPELTQGEEAVGAVAQVVVGAGR